jgi:pyocin large subunit-like protein
MPLKTKGFESLPQLRVHFGEHGEDFGASNAEEYETEADEFLGSAKAPDIHECVRKCGHIIRYDPRTEAYGILDKGGIIRTYYKPMPCSQVPFLQREAVKQAGRCHKYPNNLVYFRMECNK